MQELSWAAANLPDALVSPPPLLSEPCQDTLDFLPSGMRDGVTIFICQVDRVHHLAVDVQLQLLIGGISNSHGPGILITFEVIQSHFVQLLPAINSVHHLQRPALRVIAQTPFNPANECLCFLDKTQAD